MKKLKKDTGHAWAKKRVSWTRRGCKLVLSREGARMSCVGTGTEFFCPK